MFQYFVQMLPGNGQAIGARTQAAPFNVLIFWHLLVPIIAAPFLWWLFAATSIDKALIAPFYDATTHAFPLRDDAVLERFMHSGLKLVVIAIAASLFGAYLLSFLVPSLVPNRRRLLWMLVSMAGSTLLVSTLKQASSLHCPWDLAEYGGFAPFRTLFDYAPDNTAPGRCFPGGHASGGFALMAFYFGLRDTDVSKARLMLFVGFTLGMLMGWTQMMRGAHFFSHNVWSGWLEWMLMALLYHFVPPHNNASTKLAPPRTT